ncbi:hypothetical protein EM20IM_09165 [Candidatus Methylacidiphilum infernorum]|uniref:Uncharacterized protein n=1 Tax=Candidatus Methylacidiphilum infernorum TaxID=511746 RepID=A0ABX7PUY8_9BACT|nr:hypothetical protein [Candidatus Methylacidiphilum infernorum]QSR86635.1 hypothetical protein EM20IM_09165 [Candidatus Methylacidiphilum infernorum]
MKTARGPWNERGITDNSGNSASKAGIFFSRVGLALGPAIDCLSAVVPIASFRAQVALLLSKGIQKVNRGPGNDHRFCIELQDLPDLRGNWRSYSIYTKSSLKLLPCLAKNKYFIKSLNLSILSSKPYLYKMWGKELNHIIIILYLKL